MDRPRQRYVTTTTAVLLTGGLTLSILAHRRLERRLSADWSDLVASARSHGIRLAGAPSLRSGWPFGAVLRIDGPALGPLAADRLILSRFILRPGALRVSVPGVIRLAAGGRAVRLWGGTVQAVIDGTGRAALSIADLRIAAGAGPDDVASVAAIDGALTPGGHVGLRARGIVLPLPALAPEARRVGRAALDADLDPGPPRRTLALHTATFDWAGIAASLSGSLAADRSGQISGRLSADPGPSWRDLVARAAAARLLTGPEAQAANGLLELVAGGGHASGLPLAVDGGRVTFGGLLLLRLPPLPAAGSAP